MATIDVTWSMLEGTFTIGLVILPLTFIGSSIPPYHLAMTVSQASFPTTFINGTCCIFVSSCLNNLIWVVIFFCQCFLCFSLCKVLISVQFLNLQDFIFSPLNPTSDLWLHSNHHHHIFQGQPINLIFLSTTWYWCLCGSRFDSLYRWILVFLFMWWCFNFELFHGCLEFLFVDSSTTKFCTVLAHIW